MAIDLQREERLALSDATKTFPRVRGKRIHPSTLFRWVKNGLRGINLDYVRVGHRISTSREALSRFSHRLVEADGNATASVPVTRSTARVRTRTQKQRDIELAKNKLEKAAI